MYSTAEMFQFSRYFHLDRFGSEASIPIPDSKPEDVQDLTSHVCINSNYCPYMYINGQPIYSTLDSAVYYNQSQ